MCRRLVTLDPEWAQVSVSGWAPLAYPSWALLACENGGFLPEIIPVWYTWEIFSQSGIHTGASSA